MKTPIEGAPAPRVIVPVDHVATLAPRIAQVWPDAVVAGLDAAGALHGDARGTVALLRYFPYDRHAKVFGGARIAELVTALPTLRLLQLHSAGVDGLVTAELMASGCTLCNAAPLHAGPMAEMVLALMLAAAKRIPFHVRNQVTHAWQRTAKLELAGSTVGIVGYGRIGARVGELCAAFGMRVIGMRRTAMARPPAGIERVVGPEGLRDLLGESDWIVLTLPLTAASRGVIGERELAAMKPSACLVNVARGEVVDQAALTARLADGRLAYACLDTFATEPLPDGDPLWDLPNVLVTPHNSASSQHMERRVLDLFIDNLGRLARGEPLRNVVDMRGETLPATATTTVKGSQA